jgi:hypothetical protein
MGKRIGYYSRTREQQVHFCSTGTLMVEIGPKVKTLSQDPRSNKQYEVRHRYRLKEFANY